MGKRLKPIARDLLTFAVVFGLLAAVNLLPPDTSLEQIRRTGVLRVCVPSSYPPLVTQDPQRPGIDVEILHAVAEEMGLRLLLNTNAAMGRDFNPRNWRVTRAQCSVLAGGVVASQTTRSFLETTPPYLETGWALLIPDEASPLSGNIVGFYGGVSGLDRIALSRFLRDEGMQVITVATLSELVTGLHSGQFDLGVTEALNARQIAGDHAWEVEWLPGPIERYPLVFGLWKGDLTLKRAIVQALSTLEQRGAIGEILARYEVAAVSAAGFF